MEDPRLETVPEEQADDRNVVKTIVLEESQSPLTD